MFASGFKKIANINVATIGVAAKKIGKHLHKYRRDYLMGAATTAAASSAISHKRQEKKI